MISQRHYASELNFLVHLKQNTYKLVLRNLLFFHLILFFQSYSMALIVHNLNHKFCSVKTLLNLIHIEAYMDKVCSLQSQLFTF